MNATQVFYTSGGELRPPWRILVFLIVTTMTLLVSAVVVGPILAGLFGMLGLHVSNESWVLTVGLLAGTAIALHIDKRPWSSVWLDARAAQPVRLVEGFAIGAICIVVPMALLIAAGWLDREPGSVSTWWGGAARITAVLLPAALFEELLTRGYVLSVLREWWGWKWAVVVTSVGFGLLHLQNVGATAASVAAVTLAGFFLAAVLYATKSLYAAWMAHFAWNWMMAVAFHTAVSGAPFETPGYRYVDAGPDWATGGVWGPEGGVPAAVAMVGGMTYLLRRRGRRAIGASPSDRHTTNVENA